MQVIIHITMVTVQIRNLNKTLSAITMGIMLTVAVTQELPMLVDMEMETQIMEVFIHGGLVTVQSSNDCSSREDLFMTACTATLNMSTAVSGDETSSLTKLKEVKGVKT